MQVIKLPLLFVGSDRLEQTFTCSFDRRANLSRISSDAANRLGETLFIGRKRQIDINFNGQFFEIKEAITSDFYINDVLLSDEFLVIPEMTDEVIIGDATLRKWRIKLDFEHDTVHVDPKVAKMQLI